jgi:type VI secretion system protein ImpE
MNAKECFEAGDLAGAVAAATDEVKRNPTDTARRGFLCELLCFAGELERADKQLDTIGDQSPELIPGLSLFRQVLRGEQARQQFFREGRLPEFLDAPTPVLRLHLEASIRLREGLPVEAVALLEQAETERPTVAGICDGERFEGLRDLDDATASFFEVLTSNGKYYWIPLERMQEIELRPPERSRDLIWRRAHMIVRDGPEGEVFLPALYAGSSSDADDRIRLGRCTDWRGGGDSPVRGFGQRTFLVGEQDRPIMEWKELSIDG